MGVCAVHVGYKRSDCGGRRKSKESHAAGKTTKRDMSNFVSRLAKRRNQTSLSMSLIPTLPTLMVTSP